MWRNRSIPESDRVARYWDQVVTGGSDQSIEIVESELDPTLVQTISWLERIDDAQPASTEFSRQFETHFLTSLGQAAPKTASNPAGSATSREIPRSTPPSGNVLTLPPAPVGRRRLLISIAAGILLFLALGIGYYVRGHRGDSGDPNVILAPSSAIDVPMDRGNSQRSGVMPGPGVTNSLALQWKFEAGRGGVSAPAIVGDTLFVTGGSDAGGSADPPGSIIAIDVSSGDERWRFPAAHATGGTPAVAGGIVYAGDMGGIVYALESETGAEIWRQDLQSGWASAPVVVGDTLFIAAAPYRTSLHIAVQNGTVVVGSGLSGPPADGFRLYAFDRMTGEERWHSGDDRSGRPGIFAFDAEHGAPIWHFEMSSLESGPAISDQRVYAGSTLDGTVYALDLDSGDEEWHAAIGEDLPLDSSPAISGGSVFVTTAYGSIICLDGASGAERWRATAEHVSLNSSAIVVDGTIYGVDTAQGVIAVSAVDGSVLWTEQLDLTGQVVVSPVIVNGNLFIVTSLESDSAFVATLWAFTGSGDASRDAGVAL